MPAIAEEVDEAIDEASGSTSSCSRLRLEGNADGTALVCRRMALGEPDESGRRVPCPSKATTPSSACRCDTLLLALGQSPDLRRAARGAELEGRPRARRGAGHAPVFAGGDFAAAEGTVAAAIGSGRAAAASMSPLPWRGQLSTADARELAGPDVVTLQRFPGSPQHKGTLLEPRRDGATASARCAAAFVDVDRRDRDSPRPTAA